MSNIAVVGIGNILFCDEGLGIYATQFLKVNYRFDPPIDLIDGGTLGMNLIDYYQRYDRVLLLDTISVDEDAAAGSVYHLNSDVLQGLGNYRKTAHEIEVLQTLELSALAGDVSQVEIIAMVPEDIQRVVIDLSDTVKHALPFLIDNALSALQQWGIAAIPRAGRVDLELIIAHYNQLRSESMQG